MIPTESFSQESLEYTRLSASEDAGLREHRTPSNWEKSVGTLYICARLPLLTSVLLDILPYFIYYAEKLKLQEICQIDNVPQNNYFIVEITFWARTSMEYRISTSDLVYLM